MALDASAIAAQAAEYAKQGPPAIVALAIREYAPDLGISFSGAEDVVLIDMASKAGGQFRVFSLDTGRLHPETYQFLDKVRERYGIAIETFFPQPEAVQKLVREKGLFSFYKDGHKECCGVRKVEPLVRALEAIARLDHRTAQGPEPRDAGRDSSRAVGPDLRLDRNGRWSSSIRWPTGPRSRSGRTSARTTYPTMRCTSVASFRSAVSPARAPVHPGQHEREGRWWWEEETMKECGLHAGNVQK